MTTKMTRDKGWAVYVAGKWFGGFNSRDLTPNLNRTKLYEDKSRADRRAARIAEFEECTAIAVLVNVEITDRSATGRWESEGYVLVKENGKFAANITAMKESSRLRDARIATDWKRIFRWAEGGFEMVHTVRSVSSSYLEIAMLGEEVK